jgi:hypothetical protein
MVLLDLYQKQPSESFSNFNVARKTLSFSIAVVDVEVNRGFTGALGREKRADNASAYDSRLDDIENFAWLDNRSFVGLRADICRRASRDHWVGPSDFNLSSDFDFNVGLFASVGSILFDKCQLTVDPLYCRSEYQRRA